MNDSGRSILAPDILCPENIIRAGRAGRGGWAPCKLMSFSKPQCHLQREDYLLPGVAVGTVGTMMVLVECEAGESTFLELSSHSAMIGVA